VTSAADRWLPLAPAAVVSLSFFIGFLGVSVRSLIWGGRLPPLKARVLLETCLRAGLNGDTIAEVFDAFG
jgi:hypothetical protein